MALKKLIQIDETFPVIKKSRLGAAPPAEDVLDNVGERELTSRSAAPPVDTAPRNDGALPSDECTDANSPRVSAPKKRERAARRAGQGVARDGAIYGRRYRKTGRGFQFGARVTPEFADGIKATAAARNMTIGELLEEMRGIYDSIQALAEERKQSAGDVLAELKKHTAVF
jgi:predicted DNA-binding ribbon-helix-helix protein